MTLIYRVATLEDTEMLAALNAQLIRDEGHRNPMTPAQLRDRMHSWLGSEYQAVLFERNENAIGYALYRHEPDFIYLRQFFVASAHRRQGVGRAAIAWLWRNAWTSAPRLRLDVLVGNIAGREFWRHVGFSDYCIAMEARRDPAN